MLHIYYKCNNYKFIINNTMSESESYIITIKVTEEQADTIKALLGHNEWNFKIIGI